MMQIVNKFFLLPVMFLVLSATVFAQETYEEVYKNLRTLAYNSTQSLESEVLDYYNKAILAINDKDKVIALTELSQCDYLMGLYYIDRNEIEKASSYLEEAINLAKKSINITPTAQGYVAFGESLAQICTIKPPAYVIANGLTVPSIAKKALKLDECSGAARYLICCVIVYAPKPLRHLNRGEVELKEILEKYNIDEEDRFNLYRTIGYINYQQKKFDEADKWFNLASEIYPYNKFLVSLKSGEYNQEEFVNLDDYTGK